MTRLTPTRLVLALIGLPVLLAMLYFMVLSSDRYVSTSVLTVRRANQDTPAANGLSMLLSGGAAASQEDTRYLQRYLHSLALVNKLEARLHLRAHFESAHTDWLFRLWPGTRQEDWLDYWRQRVEVALDEPSGLLTVRTQGFDPAFAQRINQALLQEAESFVNDIAHRIANEQLAFAQTELSRATDRLELAEQALVAFQTHNQRLDPLADAQATGARTASLRDRLAKLEAELSAKQSFLHDEAPDIVTLKAELAAVKQQVDRETRLATASTAPGTLNKLAVEFHGLKTRATLADGAYKSALASVETTRIETSRKLKTLVVIEPPTRPELAEYPRRLYNMATLLLGCLMVYATVTMAVTTVREHRD